jgi:hypothetical protein
VSTEQQASVRGRAEGRQWAGGYRPPPWWVVACAAAIPVLMTGSWLLADARHPVPYSPVRQSVSVLAGHAGHDRWIVTGALLVVAGCYLVIASQLAPLGWPARVGLVIAGGSAIGIAVSPEPRHGSTPQHLVFTGIGAIAIAVWPLLLIGVARRAGHSANSIRSIGLDPLACELAGAVFIALLLWTFAETRSGDYLGLAERVSSSSAIGWPVFAVVALRERAIVLRIRGPHPESATRSRRGTRSWPAR